MTHLPICAHCNVSFCLLKRRQLFALKHGFDHNVLQAGSGSASFVGSILAGVILLTGPIAAFGVNRYQKDLDNFLGMPSKL